MPTLYVTQPGAVVRRSSSSLIVTAVREDAEGKHKQETLAQLQPHRVEAICLTGRTHMTLDATRLCLARGIAVSWFGRGGRLKGRLVPRCSRTADVRVAQYALTQDPNASLDLGRQFIAAKLRNGAALLSVLRSNRPGAPQLGKAIRYLRSAAGRAARSTDSQVLLGIEGDAAKTYFGALGCCFDADIRFESRLRRPPPDPANALLSFGYVLLANRMASLLEAVGLDPYVGFLHTLRSGRPSLALDLIEELRHPLVDRFVLRLCNRRQLQLKHFEPDATRPGGVRLDRDGARIFFAAWESLLRKPLPGHPHGATGTAVLTDRASLIASHVRHGESYAPFLIPEKA